MLAIGESRRTARGLTSAVCLLSFWESLSRHTRRKKVTPALFLMGLVGLFFVYGYFPASQERHPADESVASLVMACSVITLGCVAVILLFS
jgi:hypothetical protein